MKNSQWSGAIERLEPRMLLSLGAVDTSFSGDGTASYEYQGEQYSYNASSFAVARDQSVIVAGTTKGRDEQSQILLARMGADGRPVENFGNDGYAITALSAQAAA